VLVRARHTETVRKAFDLFEAGEVDALVTLYHPQVEIRVAGVLRPPATAYFGAESARSYLHELVAEGMNCGVEGLELVEVGERVVAAGRMAAPANVLMRWNFDFEDDLISRVEPLEEAGWAQMGARKFSIAQVAEAPVHGTVALRLGDGRSLSVPIDRDLVTRATPRSPVLVYFDGGRLVGWYLPDDQRGMVLR